MQGVAMAANTAAFCEAALRYDRERGLKGPISLVQSPNRTEKIR
jgi:hypothetical protein